MKPGRNDPCPCGSGKKYKHCCLVAQHAHQDAPDNLAWRRLRRLLDEHQREMLRFVTNVYGRDAFTEAWRAFLADAQASFDPESEHLQVFMSWFWYRWSPDPARTGVRDRSLHGVAPLAEYLGRKKRLDPLLREYLESCLAAPFSAFEVERADAGRGMLLRDLFGGEAHDVFERSASAIMQPGDLVIGQVAAAGGVTLIETCQPFAIGPIWKIELVKLRQAGSQGEREAGLLALYREIYARFFERRLPALQNTDGDPLSPRRVVFDVPSTQEAFDALKHLALGTSDEELLDDAERDAGGRLARAGFSWLKLGNARNPEMENTVLGSIEIAGTRLTAEVNSEAREQALREHVFRALGERSRYRATEIQSMEKLLAGAGAPRRPKENDALAELPEVKAKIAEMMAKHYEHWVDESIPALGGRTPREAASDPAGRESVEALVRQIERDGERMAPPLDPAILRSLRERLRLG